MKNIFLFYSWQYITEHALEIIAVVIAIGVGTLMGYYIFKIYSEQNEQRSKISKMDSQIYQLRNEVHALGKASASIKSNTLSSSQIQNHNYPTSDTENKIKDIYQRLTDLEGAINAVAQRLISQNDPAIPTNKKISTSNVFYAPIPNISGDFRDDDMSDTHDDETSMYKFQVRTDREREFEPLNKEYAIKWRDRVIQPMCSELNVPHPGCQLKVDKPGRSVLENGIWELRDKAVVKYV